MTTIDRTDTTDTEFAERIAAFDTASVPPETYLPTRPVACENCWTRFPARYQYEPSLPPHDCTERAARRRAGDPR